MGREGTPGRQAGRQPHRQAIRQPPTASLTAVSLTRVGALDEWQQDEEGNGGNVLQQEDAQGGLPHTRVQLASLPQQLQHKG